MRRIRMIIAYDGTEYVGWQVQPNGPSIQETLQRELNKLTGEEIVLNASGRTDSGVHARAQVAHFDTQSRIPPEKFAYALNAGLPRDIRVWHSGLAPEGFHARFDVVRKHYRYCVYNAPHLDVFTRRTSLHVHHALDLGAMERAAELILGEHDFRAFKAAGARVKSTERTIYVSRWSREGNMLSYDIAGSGFLYNMVRILAGTMLEIGMGLRPVSDLKQALAQGERDLAGATAPAHGLTMTRVEYPDFDTNAYPIPF